MPDIKRRNVIKGISIMGAASLAPVSLQAAKLENTNQSIVIYVNEAHGKFKYSLANEVVNTSRQPVFINTKEPVGYKQSNGKNFAIYANAPDDGYVMQPGERLTIYARSSTANPAETMLIPNTA